MASTVEAEAWTSQLTHAGELATGIGIGSGPGPSDYAAA